MSAECEKHGTDLLYGEGGIPDYCPSCELESCRASLAAAEKGLEHLLSAMKDAGFPHHNCDECADLRAAEAQARTTLGSSDE